MKMTHAVLTAVASFLLAMPMTASAQQPTRSITEIAENLYWARNNNHYAVVLVTSDGVILVDTINADFSEWLKGEIESRFGVPVRYVLYSHNHWDHASGGAVFADTATFVGHANMLGNLAMPPADTPLSAAAAALDVNSDGYLQASEATGNFAEAFAQYDASADGRLSGAEIARGPVSEVRAPDVVYKDRMTVRLGDSSAELIYAGRMAHTDDMSVVRFADQRAVFVVDFISLGRLPFQALPDGPLDPWLNAMRAVENLDVDIVAPGHGIMGDLSDVAAHRRYIEELRDLVGAGIARGASLEELQAEIMMTPYQDWISYAQWRPLNVAGMYRILTTE